MYYPKYSTMQRRSNELDSWPENTGLHDSKKDGMMFCYPKKMGFQKKGMRWHELLQQNSLHDSRHQKEWKMPNVLGKSAFSKQIDLETRRRSCIVVFHPNQSTSTAAQPPPQQRCHLPHPWAIRWWHLPRAGLLCLGQVELTFFALKYGYRSKMRYKKATTKLIMFTVKPYHGKGRSFWGIRLSQNRTKQPQKLLHHEIMMDGAGN